MYFICLRLIRNDVLKSKAVTFTAILFVAASALLVALAATLVFTLSGAIDSLMTRAKTPHFTQMHAGELDLTRLETFAGQHDGVMDFQAAEFLNIDGADIAFDGGTLAESIQDNGLSVQNPRFDLLLDLDSNIIIVSVGEIYVPITYLQDGTAWIGDAVTIAGRPFVIAGALRDSQMQPLLSSSKRFLVHPADFEALRPLGRVEWLIEFRLHDPTDVGGFEADYAAAELEANGPTLTYGLFRVLNGLSDGLMAAVMLLLSGLSIAIAFLCIRFTLLAKIEDDNREIGVMKAIGLRLSDIKSLYLVKYAVIAAVGSLTGYALSFIFQRPLLANIRLYMGEGDTAGFAPSFAAVGVLAVCLAIIASVNSVLGRFRRITPAGAIRFGMPKDGVGGGRFLRLSRNRLLGTNVFLGVKDVLSRKRLYATMLVVLMLSAFIIIVPMNLQNTIASNSFITYMGVGDSDLRIDIQTADDDLIESAAAVERALDEDNAITRHVTLTTRAFEALVDDGSNVRLMIELGDHSVFPLAYAEGRAPAADEEIALSVMLADELGRRVGDTVAVRIEGRERTLTISGTYSDVTNGGRTSKATFAAEGAPAMRIVISAALADPSLRRERIDAYAESFPYAKVSDIDAFVDQTYGPTIAAISTAARAAFGSALVITSLIVLLFMNMLVAKDRHVIAVMRALGFTVSDIRTQYLARSVFVLVFGVLGGTLLANTMGEVLARAVIGSFGATTFEFVVDPLSAYLLCPVLMFAATLMATFASTIGVKRIRVAGNIRE